jgi:hypothetical protein
MAQANFSIHKLTLAIRAAMSKNMPHLLKELSLNRPA